MTAGRVEGSGREPEAAGGEEGGAEGGREGRTSSERGRNLKRGKVEERNRETGEWAQAQRGRESGKEESTGKRLRAKKRGKGAQLSK